MQSTSVTTEGVQCKLAHHQDVCDLRRYLQNMKKIKQQVIKKKDRRLFN